MRSLINKFFALIVLTIVCALVHPSKASARQNPSQQPSQAIVITRSSTIPSIQGPADHFVGAVKLDMLAEPREGSLTRIESITFAPGAHTNWHSHPLGQTLVVTAGTGYMQQWGGKVQEFHAGDVIWTPPNVKHWHGAGMKEPMTHMSIYQEPKGQVTQWMERVTDEQYSAAH